MNKRFTFLPIGSKSAGTLGLLVVAALATGTPAHAGGDWHIAGIVVHADGAPAVGATVLLRLPDGPVVTATTDTNGRYEVLARGGDDVVGPGTLQSVADRGRSPVQEVFEQDITVNLTVP